MLQIAFQPKQKELLRRMNESPAIKHGFGGAWGSAKSHGLRLCFLWRSMQFPGRRLIIRRKRQELRENHIEPLFKQFPFMRKWYNQGTNALTLQNWGKVGVQSTIVFGYAEHPAKNETGDIYTFQGTEWDDIGIDEAQQFNEEELTFLAARCRTTAGNFVPKSVWTMNPGSIGHRYIKRVMIDRKYIDRENPRHFDFLQAFGWDNIEWTRPALKARRWSDKRYYHDLTDQERFELFTQESDYGQMLNALSGKKRLARLMGDWESFKDQFFDVWNEQTHVKPAQIMDSEIQANPWWPKWVSIDWGFEHECDVQWHAQSNDNKVKTYRELTTSQKSPQAIAQEIIRMTPPAEQVQDVVVSWDAMSKRWQKGSETISQLFDKAFRDSGRIPYCRLADNERVGGWMLLYQMLETERWEISAACERLVEKMPDMIRDPNKPEDVLKVDGDDAPDCARYGLKSRLSPCAVPVAVQVQTKLAQFAENRGLAVEQLQPTTIAHLSQRLVAKLQPPRLRQRFRPGRPVRQGAYA